MLDQFALVLVLNSLWGLQLNLTPYIILQCSVYLSNLLQTYQVVVQHCPGILYLAPAKISVIFLNTTHYQLKYTRDGHRTLILKASSKKKSNNTIIKNASSKVAT